MIKEKTITPKEIIWFIHNCFFNSGLEDVSQLCEDCPISAECLYYWTGDDSELKED